MRDDGYTLVEVLVALMIIGLSLSALFAAVNAQAQLQRRAIRRTEDAERRQTVSSAMNALMAGQGPFSSAGGVTLQGDGKGFSFDCGRSPPCGASAKIDREDSVVTVRAPEGIRAFRWTNTSPLSFSYLGARTVSNYWPPDNPTNWQRLRAIALVSAKGGAPVALTKIWVEGGQVRETQALKLAAHTP